jgi:hypothetical protein
MRAAVARLRMQVIEAANLHVSAMLTRGTLGQRQDTDGVSDVDPDTWAT